MHERILVVEDEPDIAELIEYNLRKGGYAVQLAIAGEEVFSMAHRKTPQLILLDLMLPGVDGLEVCRRLKEDPLTAAVPIIMVTAKGEESDVVKGLELGADDYVVKPFSPKVLMARVKAVLRRGSGESLEEESAIRIGVLELYPGRHVTLVNGEAVRLTYTEFNMLLILARRPGWVFTRSQICQSVRGESYHVTERSVDVHIRGLRKKLGSAAAYLETVRGVGYRFREET